MKKLLILMMFSLLAAVACERFDDSNIWNKLNEHEDRIDKLETLCSELNTNVSALQTLVSAAIQNNDYVTGVVPIENGYVIAFLKRDPITLYHGTDGATPIVGVAKDADDVYYWTINGTWLLDEDGHKVKAVGTDGSAGASNCITPRLKIAEGMWFVSYDDGETWNEVGQATGDSGQDGDAFFKSVDDKKDYLSVVLADGTEFKMQKYSAVASSVELYYLTFNSAIFVGRVMHHSVDLRVTIYYGTMKNISIYNSAKVVAQEFDGDEFALELNGLLRNTEYYYFTEVVCNGTTTFSEVSSFVTPSPVAILSTLDSDVICDLSKVSEGVLAKQETLTSTELAGYPSFDLVDVWQVHLQPRDWTTEEKMNYEWDDRLDVWAPDGDCMVFEFNLPVNSDGNIAPEESVEYTYTIQPNCSMDSLDYYLCVDEDTCRPYNDLFHPETVKYWGYASYSWFPKEFDYCNSRRGFTWDGWFRGVWYYHLKDGKYYEMDEYAPAVKGTIKVVRAGENYSFKWELYDDAPIAHRITGQWSGLVRIKNS